MIKTYTEQMAVSKIIPVHFSYKEEERNKNIN